MWTWEANGSPLKEEKGAFVKDGGGKEKSTKYFYEFCDELNVYKKMKHPKQKDLLQVKSLINGDESLWGYFYDKNDLRIDM